MMSREQVVLAGVTGMLCMSAAMISGCAKEAEPVAQAPAPPPAPPAPAKPKVASIADLMAELNIDPRVNLPEDLAPATTEERKAVLTFFDAFARGDSKNLKGMFPPAEQRELEALVKSGQWKADTSKISSIEVITGPNQIGQACALAVITVGQSTFEPQLWYYQAPESEPTFEAASSPPDIMERLSGDKRKWIDLWHQIIAQELAIAEQPDVEFVAPKRDESGSKGSSGGGDVGGGTTPGKKFGRPATPGVKPPKPPSFKGS